MAKKPREPEGIRECLALISLTPSGQGPKVDLVQVVAAKALLSGWAYEDYGHILRFIPDPTVTRFRNVLRDFETGFDDPVRVVNDWNKFLKNLSREVTPP